MLPSRVKTWRVYENYFDLQLGLSPVRCNGTDRALIEQLEALSSALWMTPGMRYALAHEGSRLMMMAGTGSTTDEVAREEAGLEDRLKGLTFRGDRRLQFRKRSTADLGPLVGRI